MCLMFCVVMGLAVPVPQPRFVFYLYSFLCCWGTLIKCCNPGGRALGSIKTPTTNSSRVVLLSHILSSRIRHRETIKVNATLIVKSLQRVSAEVTGGVLSRSLAK